MTTAHDVQDHLRSIGTAKRPVSVWRHTVTFMLSVVFMVALASINYYCEVCTSTPSSIFFEIVMLVFAGLLAAFSLFGLVQYIRHRNR